MADNDKLNKEAADTAAKAAALRAAADAPAKSKEAQAADKAAAVADDARAKAAEANRDNVDGDSEAQAANVLGTGIDPDMPVGEHMAQKFGNDPANPKYHPKAATAEEAQTVKLYRVTPDSATPIYTFVTEMMVGDYMRAGWNRSDDSGVEQVAAPQSAESVADRK